MRTLTVPVLLYALSIIHSGPSADAQTVEEHRRSRIRMVELYVKSAGVKNPRVLEAMTEVPRHEFMPVDVRHLAYVDAGVPIGEKQTISSPFIVAYMTESLDPQPTDRVLEIGTGSGYQAAILGELVGEVYTIEIVEPLGKRAEQTLNRLDYDNVHVRIGDGFAGWPEHAPFDKIIVTCSPEDIPQPLVDQLAEGGLIVVPIGERHQQTLYLMRKKDGEMVREALRPTLFVPMTGTAEEQRKVLPDGSRPELLNGSFEEEPDENGFMPGWYYQRQLDWEEDASAPAGKHFITFHNDQKGRAAHLMQGLAIDGRKVDRIDFYVSIKCDSVKPGIEVTDLPVASIIWFDADRQLLGTNYIGPFQGTRSWDNYRRTFDVPEDVREAIVRLGMFGATGEISYDHVRIRNSDPGPRK